MDDFVELGFSPIPLNQLPFLFFEEKILNADHTGYIEVPSCCKSDFTTYGGRKYGVHSISAL